VDVIENATSIGGNRLGRGVERVETGIPEMFVFFVICPEFTPLLLVSGTKNLDKRGRQESRGLGNTRKVLSNGFKTL